MNSGPLSKGSMKEISDPVALWKVIAKYETLDNEFRQKHIQLKTLIASLINQPGDLRIRKVQKDLLEALRDIDIKEPEFPEWYLKDN